MGLRRITAGEPLVTTAEAKQFLNVDFDEDDALIDGFVRAATQRLEGPNGLLGRAVTPSRWEWTLPVFPAGYRALVLPLPPTISVDSIAYIGTDGASAAFDAGLYRVSGLQDATRGAMITPIATGSWPQVTSEPWSDRVTIEFTAGFGGASSPAEEAEIEPLRLAVKMWVAEWYDNRSNAVVGTTAAEMPTAAMALIAPYRLYVGSRAY